MKLAMPWTQVEKSSAFYDRVLQRVSELPGVQAVGSINFLPFDTSSAPMSFTIEGRPQAAEQSSLAEFRVVSGDYFRTLGIPLQAGRFFAEGDTAEAPPVVMVNEKFARQFFPNENAIGQHCDSRVASNQSGRRRLSESFPRFITPDWIRRRWRKCISQIGKTRGLRWPSSSAPRSPLKK